MNINKNSVYAPGISTYGANGKTGKTGAAGNSIYYLPYSSNDINDEEKDGDGESPIEIIKTYIKTNKIVTNNNNLDAANQYLIGRNYQKGDLFITNDGHIFELDNIDEVSLIDRGSIIIDDNIFAKSNENIIYITDNTSTKLLFTNNGTIDENYNAPALCNIETSGTDSSILSIKYYSNDYDTSANILSLNGCKNGFKLNGKIYADNVLVNVSAISDTASHILNGNSYSKPIPMYDISNYLDISNDTITMKNENGDSNIFIAYYIDTDNNTKIEYYYYDPSTDPSTDNTIVKTNLKFIRIITTNQCSFLYKYIQ